MELQQSRAQQVELAKVQEAMAALPAVDAERDALRDRIAAQLQQVSRSLSDSQAPRSGRWVRSRALGPGHPQQEVHGHATLREEPLQYQARLPRCWKRPTEPTMPSQKEPWLDLTELPEIPEFRPRMLGRHRGVRPGEVGSRSEVREGSDREAGRKAQGRAAPGGAAPPAMLWLARTRPASPL